MRKTRIPAPSTSMEIPKTVQEEINTVQNKMKNAIRDHTIYFGKLKDDPNNTIIRGRIQDIHWHIISLDKSQKQVLERLRKDVEAFNAQNANGPKVSLASLLGLNNNNNHITNNNDKKSSKVVGNDANNFDVKISKDDYEDTVRNSDVPSPSQENSTSKDRSSSVETISGGEDDVIEVSMDENSNETQEETLDEKDLKSDVNEKITFLSNLNLITNARCSELQNKRVERKRRSTANPQFVYSNFETPMKRKRCTYLQSGGSAPQTRQTTARMNGPSPPPVSKTALPKSTSLPSKTTIGKSLIPLQKSMTRPNILRNASENKVYPGKGKIENGSNSVSLPIVATKTIQSAGSRTVHIPGLPSCLTIERIENDSIVCIRCRNPGTLTVCENCSANYHVSCHSVSPAPPRICPKCAFVEDDEEEEEEEDAVVQEAEEEDEGEEFNGRESCNKEEELATTSYASGTIRKAGADTEIHKTSCGLYKADATSKRHVLASALGIGQLPSSTFLIPIAPSNVAATAANHEYSTISTTIASRTDIEQSENNNCNGNGTGRSYSSIVLNHLPQSNISYVQSESQLPYTYQLPISNNVQPEKHQSYLILKKIKEPIGRSGQQQQQLATIGTQPEGQSISTFFDSQQPTTSQYESHVHSEVTFTYPSVYLEKHLSEPINRGRSKKTNRAVPGLNRIIDSEEFSITTGDHPMERSVCNGKKPRTSRQSRIKLGINHLRSTTRNKRLLLPAYDSGAISTEQLPLSNSANAKETFLGNWSKNRIRPGGGLFNSFFPSYDPSSSVIVDDTTIVLSRTTCNTNDKDRTDVYQQSYRKTDRFESIEHPNEHQRGTISKFFEHVKLEEAHISAPPRAKLACKSTTNIEIDEELDRFHLQDKDDQKNFCKSSNNEFPREQEEEEEEEERVVGPRAEDDSRSKTLEYAELVNEKSCSRMTTKGNADDGNVTSKEAISNIKENDQILSLKKDFSETSFSQSQTAQVNPIKPDDEVSVPDDKADVERQDLHGGRSSSSTPDSDVSNKTSITEEGRSSMKELDEDLGISTVSLESMRVLEQFESAMLEADCSKTATC
ncbi:PREDICTED: uncharacterized protein LOC106787989 isoform X1 [Polistes canadensis]|uniref:uncharacterized protein LOC106787989 isoform X1 n=1 Tax=Polistes canadensis TaxID=91411 RepID=UPI000718D317|nr:PREDICTED: uncharacterized protein LOC106787989 isoform X1 [Polistes canadensis]